MARLFLLCGLLLAGCANTTLDADHYERNCQSAGQCRPAYFGDLCGTCTCLNGAVNEQGYGKYEADRGRITCSGARPAIACDCAAVQVGCVDGNCVVLQ